MKQWLKKTIEHLPMDNPHCSRLFKFITANNGSEFAGLSQALQGISAVYFAHTCSSWKRGTKGKHYGILGRFIPKGKYLKEYSNDLIKHKSYLMNHSPPKILNDQTLQNPP